MEAMATRDELIAALSERMEDADLMELIDRADHAESSIEVLRSAYDAILGPPCDGDLSLSGVEIVPVMINALDQQTKQIVEIVSGYELAREERGSRVYCGVTLSWGPRYKSIPFRTVADAENAIRVWMDLQVERQKRPPVIRHVIAVHVAHGLESNKAGVSTTIKLTSEEVGKLEAILYGLRAANMELAVNQPVDSYQDVIRWLLRQIKIA